MPSFEGISSLSDTKFGKKTRDSALSYGVSPGLESVKGSDRQ